MQEVWGEALDKEEVEKSILGTVMDDILQRAMEEAIPEVVVEVRDEMEAAVQQQAALILQNMLTATPTTPVTTEEEPREGALAPSES